VSACPSGRTAPSFWNYSVSSISVRRIPLLRKWCFQAPSSNIYPRAKEVKRIGSPSATRPGAMWSDCQVGFTNGRQMAEKRRGRRFRCGRGVGCRGCLHGGGLGLHFVDREEAHRPECPSLRSGRVLRPLDLPLYSAATAQGSPQGCLQGLGQGPPWLRLVSCLETDGGPKVAAAGGEGRRGAARGALLARPRTV
jgi:hypothetical protein